MDVSPGSSKHDGVGFALLMPAPSVHAHKKRNGNNTNIFLICKFIQHTETVW